MSLFEKNKVTNEKVAGKTKNNSPVRKESLNSKQNISNSALKNKQADTKAKTVSSDNFSEDAEATIGSRRSFAMTEAHKRLRTNIMFSFADESECHVIGVTSAMAHEGKSTTSVNLAYDLMKAGKKTILIDADMRLSRIAHFLEVNRAPGLSNVLVGKQNVKAAIQYSSLHDGMEVITCGDFPPNPTELLSSKRFAGMLEALRDEYEYIVVDLPPVAEVSDALIASKVVDGMIVVVRQDYVDKRLLDDTIHQLNLSGARVIGMVLTCALYGTKYGKYKYKYKKGKKYAHNYGYGYGKRHGYYSRGAHYAHGYYSRYEEQSPAASGSELFNGNKIDE